jgi:uncharacterized protein YdeI (YjbR/CyaY-like superfamily)
MVSRRKKLQGMPGMKAAFFRSPSRLRKWFDEHHAAARELWVGYFKKGSGKPSVTWPESVDEALCVGWIDGIRMSLDEESYTIRFTPRRPRSIWSAVNIRRALVLAGEGRMKPAGLKALDARRENRSGIYSYEQRSEQLQEPYGGLLKRNAEAWSFFQAQPPSYRKAAGWWVVCARKEETRRGRLGRLIEHSERGMRIPQFTRAARPTRRRKKGTA